MRAAVRHNKQRSLLNALSVIRMDVFLSGFNVHCMDRSVIFLLNILFLSRRINDVDFGSLEVEEGVEVVCCDYTCDKT